MINILDRKVKSSHRSDFSHQKLKIFVIIFFKAREWNASGIFGCLIILVDNFDPEFCNISVLWMFYIYFDFYDATAAFIKFFLDDQVLGFIFSVGIIVIRSTLTSTRATRASRQELDEENMVRTLSPASGYSPAY